MTPNPVVLSVLMGMPLAFIAGGYLPLWAVNVAAFFTLSIVLGIAAYMVASFVWGASIGVRIALEHRKGR